MATFVRNVRSPIAIFRPSLPPACHDNYII
jgi:hypothetical protein